MQYFSILFFIMMVVLAFGNNVDLFLKYIGFIFILVLIHNGLALSTGFGMATIFKLPFADRIYSFGSSFGTRYFSVALFA